MKLVFRDGTAAWRDPGDKTFDILCSGDLCPVDRDDPGIRAALRPAALADVLPELEIKHLSAVNLEAPLTRSATPIRKSGPNHRIDPERIDLVQAGKWDVACCANNHIGDFGPEAVRETLRRLRRRGIVPVGAGADLQSARKPLLIRRHGRIVAWLAFAENEFGIAERNAPGANPLSPERNLLQIRDAAAVADITVVLVHGGNEYNPVPSPRAVNLYRAFAEAGASAVVAGHTHCPQGIELWKGIPIVYSLGNFFFPKPSVSHAGYNWWHGYSVRIRFAGATPCALDVIPHCVQPPGFHVSLLRGKTRRAFLAYLNGLCAILARGTAEIERYFDAWCMREIDGYFSTLGKPFLPVKWNDPDSVRRLVAMRNLHTCEAHNELITRTLRIVAECRQEDARSYLPRLEALCSGRLPRRAPPPA